MKAVKKRRLFGFLARKKGKDGKTTRKPKKGRVEKAKAPKKGLFGFLRRRSPSPVRRRNFLVSSGAFSFVAPAEKSSDRDLVVGWRVWFFNGLR